MHQWTGSSLVQVIVCCLFGAKPIPEPMLDYCQLDSWEQISLKMESEFYHFHSIKYIWKCCLPKWHPSCPGGDKVQKKHSRPANNTRIMPANSSPPSAAYMRQWTRSAVIQIMACRLFDAKPLSKPMLGYCQLDPWNKLQWNFNQNTNIFIQENAYENVVCETAAMRHTPLTVLRPSESDYVASWGIRWWGIYFYLLNPLGVLIYC